MKSFTLKPFWSFFRFFWLTGPLFDKELRISSKRKRNYFLRSAYIFLLIIFVAGSWLGVDELQGASVLEKSRMAEIGKSIIFTIVWFQFIAAQIIAIIILSNSISDEIYHRTLGVLMTTPINSLQIVIGKLFSKLIHIILLLAISFPVLAIVRVFGGVSWNYILSSMCITLTAAIFAGSLSLAFSIKNVHTYVVIIKTVFTIGVIYLVIPLIFAAIFGEHWVYIIVYGNPIADFPELIAFLHFNPLGTISINSAMMMSPAVAAAIPSFYWPVHCLIMLAVSALIIAYSVKVVRKVALRQILGELDLFSKLRQSYSKSRKNIQGENATIGSTKEVQGLPVLWKEIRKPIIQGVDRTNSIIGLVITIIFLLITYYVCYKTYCLDLDITHLSYVTMFVIIGMIFNLVLSVSSITSEKESMAWPLLLTTSLDDWQIVRGKAAGVFYRCLPVWLFLEGHVLIFIIVGYIHPFAILQLAIIVIGLIVFLTGFGLYLSSCFKRTTWAIVTCFSIIIVIWVIVPTFLRVVVEFTHHEEIYGYYISTNPFVQIAIVMEALGGVSKSDLALSKLSYNWPFIKNCKGVYPATRLLLCIMLFYLSLGIAFAWRGKNRIRRNVF